MFLAAPIEILEENSLFLTFHVQNKTTDLVYNFGKSSKNCSNRLKFSKEKNSADFFGRNVIRIPKL